MTIADEYVAAVNSASSESLSALFADSATLCHPLGTYNGIVDVLAFYRSVVFEGRAITEVGRQTADDSRVWAEVTATTQYSDSSDRVHAIDVFDLDDDGRIARLAIYYR